MKKTTKIIGIMLVAMMLVLTMVTVSKAGNLDPAGMAGNLTGTASDVQGDVMNIGNQIIGIITTVGVVVAVVILLVLGIKYMMGSASEKAEYKKTMIPYLVGALLIFAASMLANVVYQFANGLNS